MKSFMDIAVIIPALNEEAAIGAVLEGMPSWVRTVVVADNGSTDQTAQIAQAHGAMVVYEPRRGYGAACLRGLNSAGEPDAVIFLDADMSTDLKDMAALMEPIAQGEADLVIGSRTLGQVDKGSLTLPQRMGNALACCLIRLLWRHPYTDLGPFRAVRFDALQAMEMSDLDYGWTIQMQIRAIKSGLRVVEIPVGYHRRIGQSKISGTLHGVVGAGVRILTTIAKEMGRGHRKPFTRRMLQVFTRYPEPGVTKTRLIPALGPQGAAELQRAMTHHILNVARYWKGNSAGNAVDVRFASGSAELMESMFGADVSYTPQQEGDLGERLNQAIEAAFADGAGAVVAIGADCPAMDSATIQQAFDALSGHELVLGPASDGGYYLIGLNRPHPELFTSIDWGTGRVLAQTMQAARELGLSVAMLDEKTDIDEPTDLHGGEAITYMKDQIPRLSIIIPAINEADRLPETLESIGRSPLVETIVADGGSDDATRSIAEAFGATVIQSAPGRAKQMNAGAAVARGNILLFLHADTRLPFAYLDPILAAMQDDRAAAGAFRLTFAQAGLGLRCIEWAANLRSIVGQSPYGDQALFVRRETFEALEGFRDLPIMEDYDLVQRLRKLGRIKMLPLPAITSPRRCIERGIWRTTLTHKWIIIGWRFNVDPARLARWRNGISNAPDLAEKTSKETCVPQAKGYSHGSDPV
ncbi:MAG: TIGR04283 family arsenosugar biosynthesis glycosyltransferase [Candidatus Hydrogenedentota bacterium]